MVVPIDPVTNHPISRIAAQQPLRLQRSTICFVARDEPDEATERRCSKVGGLAYTIAAARNAGVHAGATFAETVEDPNNEVEPPAVLALAKQLYVGFAKQTSPDGARAAYYVDCLVTADAKSINGQSNIAAALAPFKTYTGEPPQKVLARQNIKIESILVQRTRGPSNLCTSPLLPPRG